MKFVVCPSSLEFSCKNTSFIANFLVPLIANNNSYELVLDNKGILLDEYSKIIPKDKSGGLQFWLNLMNYDNCYKKIQSDIDDYSVLLLLDLSSRPFNSCERNVVTSNEESFLPYKDEIDTAGISIINAESKIFPDSHEKYDDSEIRDKLVVVLQDMIAKIKSEKLEDLHNGALLLRLKSSGYRKYTLEEQVREGKSINNNVGELDLLIKDSSGGRRALIEALRSSSCGKKDNDISYHLNKLLNDYNQVGIKVNYLLVYCEAKDFSRYWGNYTRYIKAVNSKSNFSDESPLLKFEDTGDQISKVTGIRVGVSIHEKDGLDVRVYHIVCKFYSEIKTEKAS